MSPAAAMSLGLLPASGQALPHWALKCALPLTSTYIAATLCRARKLVAVRLNRSVTRPPWRATSKIIIKLLYTSYYPYIGTKLKDGTR